MNRERTPIALPEHAGLLAIDFQERYLHRSFSEEQADIAGKISTAKKLLQHFREQGKFIIFTLVAPIWNGNLVQSLNAFADEDGIIKKDTANAFLGTNLDQRLKSGEVDTLYVIGGNLEYCISETVYAAGNRGYNVILVTNAIFAKDPRAEVFVQTITELTRNEKITALSYVHPS